jgi:uncharacterized protein
MNPYLLLAIGLIGGVTSGLLGVGGGIIMVPAMTLLAKLPIKMAIGTSLAVIIPTAIVGVTKHHQLGNVNWQAAGYLAATAIIGGWCGAWLAGIVPAKSLERGFGLILILVGARLLFNRG